jgi:hypothetical protein
MMMMMMMLLFLLLQHRYLLWPLHMSTYYVSVALFVAYMQPNFLILGAQYDGQRMYFV